VPTDLNVVLKQSISNLELEIAKKNALIKIVDLPIINGNYIPLVELFQNLISNALKFCLNQPLIEVKSAQKDQDLWITISDNGIGLEMDQVETIFKPFTRIVNETNEPGVGLGLGLALCKKIAQQHKANISAQRNANGGVDMIVIFKKYNR
jgi:signal transduction histidine kinase